MNIIDLPDLYPLRARLLVCPAKEVEAKGEWLFWSQEPSLVLEQSIKTHGQLLPILVDASGTRPVLVAGFARLKVLTALGKNVFCLDLGAQSQWDKGLIYLAANSQMVMDDSCLIQALRFFHTLDHARLGEVFIPLNLDPRSRRARLALTWLELPRTWDRLLFLGHIPMVGADLLRGIDSSDLNALFLLFSTLSWSRSGAVNILTWIKEIMIRETKKASEVLAAICFQEILDARLSPKDSMAKISAEIWRLRFPHLSALEQKFCNAAQNITSQTRWQLSQIDQFESNFVDIRTRVSSRKELEHAIAELEAMATNKIWAEFFEEQD